MRYDIVNVGVMLYLDFAGCIWEMEGNYAWDVLLDCFSYHGVSHMITVLWSDASSFLLLLVMNRLPYCSLFVGEVVPASHLSLPKIEQQISSKCIERCVNRFVLQNSL